MCLCRADRAFLESWAENGMPDDQSTHRWAATDLLPRLWVEFKNLESVLEEMIKS